jgi:pfkB family carbohydrate kinase
MGGTASFAAAAALCLGHRVRVLTSADVTFEYPSWADCADLSADGKRPRREPYVSIHCIPSTETTTFEYQWAGGKRVQRLTRIATYLAAKDVPASWLNSDVWHLGPVAGEISINVVDVIPSGSFLGVTPQGWLRRVDAGMVVHPAVWQASEKILDRAQAVVLSRDDIPDAYERGAEWARADTIVAVTEAAEGATIFTRDGRIHIPALPAESVDELGSGDVFAAFFFDCLARDHPPSEAGRFASAATSLWISRRKAAPLPTRTEITHAMESLGA